MADSVRRAMGIPGSTIEASSADGQLKVSLAALPGSKPLTVCGFFGDNGLMTETAVRDAVVARRINAASVSRDARAIRPS